MDYGSNMPEPFAIYDRDTCWWRTSQTCLLTGWESYSESFPRSGMMHSGACFRLVSLERPISEIGCSLLPTPTASDFKGGSENGRDSELKHYLRQRFGWRYPPLAMLEWMMGFPNGWTEV